MYVNQFQKHYVLCYFRVSSSGATEMVFAMCATVWIKDYERL